MANKLLKRSIISTLFMLILGTLLHFTNQWFNHHPIVMIISAVHESVWEHLKLIFFPALWFYIIEIIFFKSKDQPLTVVTFIAIITGLIFIVSAFYTYTGIIGKHILIIDIGIFIIAVLLFNYLKYRLLKNKKEYPTWTTPLAITLFVGIIILFILFTFSPPQLPLFQAP